MHADAPPPLPKLTPSIGFMRTSIAHVLALGGGLGLSRYMPGTVGTLGGYPLAGLLILLPLSIQAIVLCLLFAAGCVWCEKTGRALGVIDHSAIVWDEIVAFAALLLLLPIGLYSWSMAFITFRIFDILKPWPISTLEARFKNGFGVMLDDIAAALFAGILLFVGNKLLSYL